MPRSDLPNREFHIDLTLEIDPEATHADGMAITWRDVEVEVAAALEVGLGGAPTAGIAAAHVDIANVEEII